MSSSEHECLCERCGHQGPAVRPPLRYRAALAGVYALFTVMLIGAALTGFGAVVLAPLALMICAAIQAPIAERASEGARCAKCHAYVSDVSAVRESAPREAARGVSSPALS
jgi:hypothetical protein